MNATIMKRLAFIKYLFELGVVQSRQPEPMSPASILIFHDAIELFNYLACEYHDIDAIGKRKPQPEFIDYWDLISLKLGKPLPQKESMKRLNKSRVDLKHYGILPSTLDIENFRGVTIDFFSDSAPMVFGVDFKEISLVDFVSEENARHHLHAAADCLSANNSRDALKNIALAFRFLVDDYENRKSTPYGDSRFRFGEPFDAFVYQSWTEARVFGDDGSEKYFEAREFQRNLGKFVERVENSLYALQDAIRILALGIDYRKYSKFKILTPVVVRDGPRWGDQASRYKVVPQELEEQSASPSDVQFCFDFIIEIAFQFQEFDYTLKVG